MISGERGGGGGVGRGKGEGEKGEGGRDIMIFQDNSLPMNCQLRGAGNHKNITESRACGAYKPHDLNGWYNWNDCITYSPMFEKGKH